MNPGHTDRISAERERAPDPSAGRGHCGAEDEAGRRTSTRC